MCSKTKKIIVTGATSMLGIALIESAIRDGAEVYAIIRNNTKRIDRLPTSPLIHVVRSELDSLTRVNTIPDDCNVFYHFAWAGTSKKEREDPKIQEKNIGYTLDAIDLAHNCGCSKFVGAGSQAEYGPTDGFIDDDTRFAPVTSYGVSKFAAGKLSEKKCEQIGLVHIWGRVFSVYGPHDNEGTMIDYAIKQFLEGKIAHFSTANHKWNYLYETDAGEMFYRIGCAVEKPSVYRIASKESHLLRDYIETISSVMHSEELCFFDQKNNGTVYGIDTYDERLFRDISYEPRVGFEEGIRRIIAKRMDR